MACLLLLPPPRLSAWESRACRLVTGSLSMGVLRTEDRDWHVEGTGKDLVTQFSERNGHLCLCLKVVLLSTQSSWGFPHHFRRTNFWFSYFQSFPVTHCLLVIFPLPPTSLCLFPHVHLPFLVGCVSLEVLTSFFVFQYLLHLQLKPISFLIFIGWSDDWVEIYKHPRTTPDV